MGKARSIRARINGYDWAALSTTLDQNGYAQLPKLLNKKECAGLAAQFDSTERIRKRVLMARHGFGRGEYRYFAYPLPAIAQQLREHSYPHLAKIANRWSDELGIAITYPETHDDYLTRCHDEGQSLPTPLVLKYGVDDYNCLHQDLYGELVFPLQLTVLLSMPGEDFVGGEFVLSEQRPRRQSRTEVVPLSQGDAVMFPAQYRPGKGTRGYHHLTMRHGVSRVRAGMRYATGIIFHDAS